MFVAHPLTALRLREHLTVEQLAAKSAVSTMSIARIESGLSRRPHRATLDALAENLNVKADDLERSILEFVQAQEAETAA